MYNRIALPVLFYLILLWGLLPAEYVSAQAPGAQIVIRSPIAGEALQGQVMIIGRTEIAGFVSAQIAFGYSDDPTDTWFVIAINSQSVRDGLLAVWDTTAITDGLYTLHLRVTINDGSHLDVSVTNLRVRNYTPIEINIPTIAPLQPVTEVVAPNTPIFTQFPTPTPLLPNPAALTPAAISGSLVYGAFSVLAFLLLLFLIFRIRRK